MKLFFSQKPQNSSEEETREYCFFIPIVEQIKESDSEKLRIWNLAKEPNIRRKFYSSIDLLQQSESPRLSRGKQLSCYKVLLTNSERQQLEILNTPEATFAGFLNFNAADIESLMIFKPDSQIELANPFCHEERIVGLSAPKCLS